MKKYADVNVMLTVSFDDDGENALADQAMGAAEQALSVISFNFIPECMGAEVVGPVRDTELIS